MKSRVLTQSGPALLRVFWFTLALLMPLHSSGREKCDGPDSLSAQAAELYSRLSGGNVLLKESLPREEDGPCSKRTTAKLLELVHRAALDAPSPYMTLLTSLLDGLEQLDKADWVSADVAFAPCAAISTPPDPKARSVRTACLLYRAAVRMVVAPGSTAADDIQVAYESSPSTLGQLDNAAMALHMLGAVGSEPWMTQILAVDTLLRSFQRFSSEDWMAVLSDAPRQFSPFVPDIEAASDSEEKRLKAYQATTQGFRVVVEGALKRVNALPECPERKLALVLLERLKTHILAQTLDFQLVADSIGERAEAAARAQDPVARFWIGFIRASFLMLAGEQSKIPADSWILATILGLVLVDFFPPDEVEHGFFGVWPALGVLRTLTDSLGPQLKGLGLQLRHLGSSVPQQQRLPEACAKEVQRFTRAWNQCPDSWFRTACALLGEQLDLSALLPSAPKPLREMLAAVAAMSPTCRQAVAPYFPLWLELAGATFPEDTAVIDLVGTVHGFHGYTLCSTAVVRTVGGVPTLTESCRLESELPASLQKLSDSLACGQKGACPPFDTELAHDIYQRLFGQLDGVGDVKHWIVSFSMAGTDLPLDALVSERSPCKSIPAQGEVRDPACATVKFVGTQHSIRFARDMPDALSWFVQDPPVPIRSFVSISDPVFFNDSTDTRCGAGKCQNLDGLALRQATIHTAAQRHIGTSVGLSGKAAEANCLSPDSLRRVEGTLLERDALALMARQAGWRVTLHSGLEATERNINQALTGQDVSVVHVATHLLVPPSGNRPEGLSPLFCPFGFLLAPEPTPKMPGEDGLLSIEEIALLGKKGIRAPLIVLSGCAGGATVSEGAAPGRSIASELRMAGADTVLAFQRPVEDSWAAEMTTTVLRGTCASGEPLHQALMEAKTAARANQPHPGSWASPMLYGPAPALCRVSALSPALELLRQARESLPLHNSPKAPGLPFPHSSSPSPKPLEENDAAMAGSDTTAPLTESSGSASLVPSPPISSGDPAADPAASQATREVEGKPASQHRPTALGPALLLIGLGLALAALAAALVLGGKSPVRLQRSDNTEQH